MEGSFNGKGTGKKLEREKPPSRVKTIVKDFYNWQKEHPGEDLRDEGRATILLAEILRFQKKQGLDSSELGVYGFDVEALKQGILRTAPLKHR